jgi:hypothetical protein
MFPGAGFMPTPNEQHAPQRIKDNTVCRQGRSSR